MSIDLTDPVGGRAKRALDLAVAVPLLVLASPVMAVLAVLVRRDSPGPALFKQTRIGEGGRPFKVLKFRTMVQGAQQMGTGIRVVSNDSRITPLGKVLRRTSLDELPQLINVVRGDMSLVGPRPTVPEQVEHYTEHQRRRLLARPGVTGLAQVTGRQLLPWSERIEIDITYIENWSMRRDLAIIARTALMLLRRADNQYRDAAPAFDLPRKPDSTPGAP